ncbi:MAG: hypothetical protein HRU69_06850 [Flammeovirgaceae bacterium]|nr:MAG: hypothetical protein HRU69_06850 [Flammeovirgaceae bacterium]
MIDRLIFKLMTFRKKIDYLRNEGTILGTRLKNGRKAYLYIIKDFCAEVIYQKDNAELTAEQITTFANVKEFNSYLEREFRSTF